ncbi:MAG: M67 family metallopeptidase [Planctomycetota bacterium]|nr:M67 family metallopeptidase [Planctomycetota bacterium]
MSDADESTTRAEGGAPARPPALVVPRSIYDAMAAHCVREAPLEACGLLVGHPPRALSIHPLRNELASATRYNADPRDILDAVRAMRPLGREIVAIYHSHPSSRAFPSRVDLAENHYGEIPRIIVSLLENPPETRVWRLDPASYEELIWRIEDEPA